jgi:hypothetical protein
MQGLLCQSKNCLTCWKLYLHLFETHQKKSIAFLVVPLEMEFANKLWPNKSIEMVMGPNPKLMGFSTLSEITFCILGLWEGCFYQCLCFAILYNCIEYSNLFKIY